MVAKYILCGLFAAIFSCMIAPLVIGVCKRLKAGQSILHYVDKHASKDGTPTMGGFIFLIGLLFSCLFLLDYSSFLPWFAVATTFAYALLGFLDDFIKVKYKNNAGLKPYQKIVGQVGIAIIVGVYLYLTQNTTLFFFSLSFDVGAWIIPIVLLVLVATTNSVNLTDGLDGLAGGVTFVCVLCFGILLAASGQAANADLAILCFGLCGSLVGFLLFNVFPAKIFMGDTGSLALGGFVAVVASLSGLQLLIPIIGIMFVTSAVSVILQVAYFKKTRKRIFLMAPLHHHFEKKGLHENRIVAIYIFITAAVCLTVLSIAFAVGI